MKLNLFLENHFQEDVWRSLETDSLMLSADWTEIAHYFHMRSVQRQCQMGKAHLLHILQNKQRKKWKRMWKRN